MWSIFDSHTSGADHVTRGNVYLYLCTERSEVRVTVGVIVFCNVRALYVWTMMKGREKVKHGAGTQSTPFDKYQGDRRS